MAPGTLTRPPEVVEVLVCAQTGIPYVRPEVAERLIAANLPPDQLPDVPGAHCSITGRLPCPQCVRGNHDLAVV